MIGPRTRRRGGSAQVAAITARPTVPVLPDVRALSRTETDCQPSGTAERFRWYGATGETGAPSSPEATMERPMPRPNDSHRSLLPLEQESTLIAVVELSRSSWLVAGIVPGL